MSWEKTTENGTGEASHFLLQSPATRTHLNGLVIAIARARFGYPSGAQFQRIIGEAQKLTELQRDDCRALHVRFAFVTA